MKYIQYKDEVINKYSQGNTTVQISESLNIPTYAIRRLLYGNNIKLGHKTPFKSKNQILISSQLIEIINGSLLGDGFLSRYITNSDRKNCNSKLMINYSTVNVEYANYIFSLLNLECKTYKYCFNRNLENKKIKDNGIVTINTCQNQSFNSFRDIWYPFGIKMVPSNIVLTPLTVAVWFQDDGYKHKSGSYYLCTDNFSFADLKILQKALLRDFNVKSSVHWNGIKQRIYIKKESSETFKNITQSFICPFMKYKLH